MTARAPDRYLETEPEAGRAYDDPRIARLEARVAELEKVITGLRALFTGTSGAAASDRELDGQYGDPDVRFVPRSWTDGGVVKGQRFSRCPPEFLDVLAESYDFFAEKNDAAGAKAGNGKPKSMYDRQSAKLARGWARRIRAGWTPPPTPTLGAPSTAFGGAGGSGPFSSANTVGAVGGAGPRFGQGRPAFGGGAPAFGSRPQTPPDPAPDPVGEPPRAPESDTSFNFGANAAPQPPSSTELADGDFDDEPPLT